MRKEAVGKRMHLGLLQKQSLRSLLSVEEEASKSGHSTSSPTITTTDDERQLERTGSDTDLLRQQTTKMLQEYEQTRQRLLGIQPPRSMSSLFSMTDDLSDTTSDDDEDLTMQASFHHEIYSPNYVSPKKTKKPTVPFHPKMTLDITKTPTASTKKTMTPTSSTHNTSLHSKSTHSAARGNTQLIMTPKERKKQQPSWWQLKHEEGSLHGRIPPRVEGAQEAIHPPPPPPPPPPATPPVAKASPPPPPPPPESPITAQGEADLASPAVMGRRQRSPRKQSKSPGKYKDLKKDSTTLTPSTTSSKNPVTSPPASSTTSRSSRRALRDPSRSPGRYKDPSRSPGRYKDKKDASIPAPRGRRSRQRSQSPRTARYLPGGADAPIESSQADDTAAEPSTPYRQPSPQRRRRSQSPKTPKFLKGAGSVPSYMANDINGNDHEYTMPLGGNKENADVPTRRQLYAAARAKCLEMSTGTLASDIISEEPGSSRLLHYNHESSARHLQQQQQQQDDEKDDSFHVVEKNRRAVSRAASPRHFRHQEHNSTAKHIDQSDRSSSKAAAAASSSSSSRKHHSSSRTLQASSRTLQASSRTLQASSRTLQKQSSSSTRNLQKQSSSSSSRRQLQRESSKRNENSSQRKSSFKQLLEKSSSGGDVVEFGSERTTPSKMDSVLNYDEWKSSSTGTNSSKEEHVPEAPPLATTPKSKSILKSPDTKTPIAVRSGLAAVHEKKAPDIQGTIIIRHDDSDAITVLTMEDFKKQKSKLKKTTTRHRSHKPSKQQRNPLQGIAESEQSTSAHQRDGLSDAGLAQILRKDIYSKKEPVLIAGLDAIKEFANKGSKQRAKLCAFGAIPSILHVMDSRKATTRNVLQSALGALEKMTAKDVHSQEAACDLGAIATIALAVQRDFSAKNVVLAACKTLERITSCMRLSYEDAADDKDTHEDVTTQGAMTVLSCCLMTHPKDKEIYMYGIGAITNLCMYRPMQIKLLSESGGIAAMQAAVKRKWKSKTRQKQALKDLEVLVESVGFLVTDDIGDSSSDDESTDSENEDDEEQDGDEEKSFTST